MSLSNKDSVSTTRQEIIKLYQSVSSARAAHELEAARKHMRRAETAFLRAQRCYELAEHYEAELIKRNTPLAQ